MQSCKGEVDHQLKLNFYYKNNSNRTIQIRHFDDRNTNGELVLVYTFTILPQDSALFISIDEEGDENYSPEDFDRYFQMNPTIDSVYIEYDSEKFQAYTLEDAQTRNVLDMSNYKADEISNNNFRFVYTFTEDDYQNAEEL
ncbi:hypothetical protein [Pontibacter populi]|uniref:Uncharacterized protein n=1 Tax=Pontibacter populi TaxID=890055 RepID=A0ABV1RNZ1_9BACT